MCDKDIQTEEEEKVQVEERKIQTDPPQSSSILIQTEREVMKSCLV